MFNFSKKNKEKTYKFKPEAWSSDAYAFECFIASMKNLEALYGGKIKFVKVERDFNGYISFIIFKVEK